MRKFFTRLLLMVTLFSVISLVSLAQSWTVPKLTPVDGACTVAKSGQVFTIDFGEAILPIKGGKISLNASNGTQLYPIQFNWDGTTPPTPMVYTSSITPFGTVTFSGNKVIIDFKATGAYALTEKENYYMTVHPNSIKRASTSVAFPGIGGTYPDNGALTCNNDGPYGWDFTVEDATAPAVTLFRPLDEAMDVDPAFISTRGIKIQFNERMQWAAGKSLSGLAPGDIALYTTTDPILGQYGGDVIFLKPSDVIFYPVTNKTPNYDSVVIKWPGSLPSLTNMYVRIKSGLFAEYQECPSCTGQTAPKVWGGINTNGTGANGVANSAVPWNFTTKDTRAPKVTITRENCLQNSNFIVTIDEGNIVTAVNLAKLNNSNVDAFVTFSGGAFDAKVVNNPGSTVITIDPTDPLVSGATTTISLLGNALWDASQNFVPAKTESFTNGDYLAPVFGKKETVDQVGTSFDILAKLDEPATVYYVVVKKSDVLKSGAEYWTPTFGQVDTLANLYDNTPNPKFYPSYPVDMYNDTVTVGINAMQLANYLSKKTPYKTIPVWAAGKFNISSTFANTDVLERVGYLPRTDGTDYLVYVMAIDKSVCGPYNQTKEPQGWATGVMSFPGNTVDILPPKAVITGTEVTPTQTCQDFGNKIKRNGPLVVTFNEPVRLADGNAITPASLKNIFVLTNTNPVNISSTLSSIDATGKIITIYPDNAFASGSTVMLRLLVNKVEDVAGNEKNTITEKSFCVEDYCEPRLLWTADKVTYPGNLSIKTDQKLDKVPANFINNVEVAANGTIKITANMKLFATADNEPTPGKVQAISNDSTLLYWIGRYIKVRESAANGGSIPSGTLIYSKNDGKLGYFDVSIAYPGDTTIITIVPKGNVFKSEMWYNVEIEGQLQNAERLTILNHSSCNVCPETCNQYNHVWFQITDTQAPTVEFWQADINLADSISVPAVGTMTNKLNSCVSCNTPTLNIHRNSRIGVKITEWIELGFDGFRDLQPTQTIRDANALRRYFALTKCDGTAVKFDVEDFSLDPAGKGTASMYINPYYPPKSEYNFVPGETYTVKFISNQLETGYGPAAFEDKHGNLMSPAESCFKIFKVVSVPLCYSSVVMGQQATGNCTGIIANSSTFNMAFNFSTAMKQNLSPYNTDPAVVVYQLTNGNGSYTNNGTVFATNFNTLIISNGASTFTVNNTNSTSGGGNPALFVENTKFYIAVKQKAFSAIDANPTCNPWPVLNSKTKFNLANDYVIVDSLKTVDSTPPLIVTLSSGAPNTTGSLGISDSLAIFYNEKIYPVAGQFVEVFEYNTNTRVARFDVAGLNPYAFTWLKIPSSYFNQFLEYGKTYYVQFNTGLVKDACGNASAQSYLDKDTWKFVVGPNPPPNFYGCPGGQSFYPKDNSYITELTPTLSVKFTEPVNPVADKKIDLYEKLTGDISIKGNWFVTSMTANADKTVWSIPFSAITTLAPNTLTWGSCYYLNIQESAFQEVIGTQKTPALVSFVTQNPGATVTTACTWDFCVGDIVAPTVKFWPVYSSSKKINIPLNAYLFASISEPLQILPSSGPAIALTPENAATFFKLEKSLNGTDFSSSALVPFKLEFVNNDKQKIMVTPLDPEAPDFSNSLNPTMDDDRYYKLSVTVSNTTFGTLADLAGNAIDVSGTKGYTHFQTEDIICPKSLLDYVGAYSTNVTSQTATGFSFHVKLDEKGIVKYTITNVKTNTVVQDHVLGTNRWLTANKDTTIKVTGLTADEASGYNFDVKLYREDDEVDLYATDAQILAQWPWTDGWGMSLARIRDMRPAPNKCDSLYFRVRLCDDDAPQITDRTPAIGDMNVAANSNITFTLDSYIELDPTNPNGHNTIKLRDYENNLTVSATVTLASITVNSVVYPNRKVIIDPDGPLADQHRYYVEIERYAVKDSGHCAGAFAVNYLPELVPYPDKVWWFKTKDNTPPDVLCNTLLPTGNCIDKNADLVVTVSDGNTVTTNPSKVPFIDIYEEGSSIPHERVSTAGIVGVPDASGLKYTFTFPTSYFYLSGKCYRATIPAGLFIDPAGNASTRTCTWSFCAQDYEAPVATWKVVEDFSYMYIARTDPNYEREYQHGDAGATLTGIPTSSFFYMKFHEPVEVLDTIGTTDHWRTLDSGSVVLGPHYFDITLLANALKITNVTTGKVLKYGPQYWIQNDFYHPKDRFKIIITDDFSHIGYSGAPKWSGSYDFPFGSMMSNATYKIEINKDWVSDLYSETCKTRNIITNDVLVVTATTRNDVPPTLTIKDANGAVICDANCNKDWTLSKWWSNMTQPNNWTDNCCNTPSDSVWWNWQPEWPGMKWDAVAKKYIIDTDTICNICVAPSDHITLDFGQRVVKTPTELINRQPFWWEGHGVQWWTEANLDLKPTDFADTTDNDFHSRFIKFQRWTGEGWVDVPLDHAVVSTNGKIDLFWDDKLVSEGVYAITFAPYTVKDVMRVPDGNEFLGMTCTFKVVDHLKPELVTPEYVGHSLPCTGQWDPYPTDVDTNTQLAMIFNEPVQKGMAGKKLIIRRENGQQQQIIDVSQIEIDTVKWIRDGSDWVLNPYRYRRVYLHNGDFEEYTLYYVEVQPGFIADTARCGRNYWDGIDPEDSEPGWQALIPGFEWVFKTGDNTPPTALQYIPNRRNDVSRETDLTIIFKENISIDCLCPPEQTVPGDNDSHVKGAPMTWTDYMVGKGFYIYSDNGATPSQEFGNIVEFVPFYYPSYPSVNPRVRITGTDIYNGKVADKIVIDPVTVFQKNMTYYIRVSDSLFCDGFKNFWAGVGDSTTWKFTITNDVEPEISWTYPAYEKMDDPLVAGDYPKTIDAMPNGYAITDLKMAFVDKDNKLPLAVKAGAGNIRIYEYIYNPLTFSYYEKLWKTIPITDPSVIFKGDTVIVKNVTLLDDINPQNCLSPRMYYVTVDPGAVTNGFPGSLTYWEGFNDPFDWRFYTAPDNTFMSPYTIVKPLGTNLTIPGASTLQITFAENIEAIPGTTGKVKLYKNAGDVLVDQFTVVPANISGKTLTLVTTQVVDETAYYVKIDAGALGDTSTCSTPFAGILDKTTWTFATGDNTAPVPTLAVQPGQCEKTCVTVMFTFTETLGVTPAAGKINLLKEGVVFESKTATIGANNNTITATFCNLPDLTVFTVSLDADVVKDNGNNHISNVAVANPAWTFKTGDNTPPVITEWAPTVSNAENSVVVTVKASEKVDKVSGKKVTVAAGTSSQVSDVSAMTTADDGLTYTLVVSGLIEKTTYTVTIEAGAFKDRACSPNATALETTWVFSTDDNTAPVVTPYKPVQDEVLSTYHGMGISFTVSEPVKPGTGNITVTRGTNVLTLPIGSDRVVIDGTRVNLVLTDMLYFGKVLVDVPAGAFLDLAVTPNPNADKAWSFWITDTTSPNCLTIMSPKDGTEGVLRSTDLVMKFCEWMAPGNPAKMLKLYEILEVQGQLPTNKLHSSTPITLGMITNDVVMVPVSNLKDNTGYTVMVDNDAIRDEAGNPWEGIADPVQWNFRTGDNTAPTVVLVPTGSTNNKNQFEINAVFSEKVVVPAGAITATNTTVPPVITTADNIIFKIVVTAADNKTVVITVPVSITDVVDAKGYGNPLAAQVTGSYSVGDNTAPTVAITSQPADKTNTARTFNVVLTFSEQVSGVAAALAGSVGMTGVTSADDIVYTVAMAGTDETQVKLVLDKALVKDVSDNKNPLTAGLSETYTIGDWVAPTATVVPSAKSDIRDAVLNVTVTFSETVIVPVGGFVVTGGTLGTVSNVGNVYTLPLTAADGATVKLDLKSTITDDSKNLNPIAAATYTYSFGDRTAPIVSVVKSSGVDLPNTFDVVIKFNESVTGVDLTSVKLAGKRPAIVLSEIVAGQAYLGTLSGADGDNLTLSFTEAIKDLAGNKLVPVSFSYGIADTKAPTVVATPASGTNLLNKNVVNLKFSEDVKNALTGVTVTGATTSAVEMVKDSLYKVTFEGADMATVKINVTAAVTDLKGNAIVPVSFSYEIGDHVAPTATVVPASNDNALNTWNVVVTFSEAVVGADAGIKVTGATGVVTSSGNVYTVKITGLDGAAVKLNLASTITDASANKNPLAAAEYKYTIGDNTAPTVTATGPAAANNTLNDFTVTLVFSEEVTGVAAALAGSTGVTGVTPSADGKSYVVAMKGDDGAKLKLVLDKALVKDVSANKNVLAAGLDLAYTVGDHKAPTATIVPATADKAPNKWNVVITFSEAVVVPPGAISVTGGTGTVSNTGSVYTVAIEAADLAVVTLKLTDAITDASLNANKYAGSVNTYTVGDNTAPKVTINPATGTNMANTFAVIVTFSEKVAGVSSSTITVSGTGATIALVTVVDGLGYQATISAPDKTNVTLTISAAIKDLAGNALASTTAAYTVGDHVAPTLLSAAPASGTGNLKSETKIKLTFSEDVTGVPAALSATGATVTVTGTGAVYDATIKGSDLASVVLTIANSVADLAGNKFAGAALNYTIGDNTAPKLLTWTPNGVTTEDNHPIFVMTFDENVVAGDGNLYVYQTGVSGAFVTVPIVASMVNGKTITVVYDAKTHGALDKSAKYYVLVDASAVKDANGNKFAGVSDTKAWTFTTGPKFATSATDLSSIEFKVYPNPFNEYLNVQNNDKLTRLTITNIAGQRVVDVAYPERVIRTQNLVSGVYVITLFTEDGIAKSERIVKR